MPLSIGRRRALALLGSFVAAPFLAPRVGRAAEAWPIRSVKYVNGFPAGGATDTLSRVLCQKLSERSGQSFVVENKAGAGGNLGAAEVAKAMPDGYTFLMGTPGTQAINQFLYPKMPYDTAKDLVPVSFVVRVPNVLMVNPQLPAKDIKALIALLKAQPGKLSYGTPGNGSTGHLSTELFKTQAGVFVTHIPYRGSGPMLQDLMAGQVQMSIDNMPSALPLIQAGKLVALGVTSAQPVPQLPGVPAIASVLPGYEAEAWFVLVAPAGTPQPIIDKLSAEVDRLLKKPDVAERFAKLGATPVGGTPKQLGDFIAAETRKWQKVVKDSGAKVD